MVKSDRVRIADCGLRRDGRIPHSALDKRSQGTPHCNNRAKKGFFFTMDALIAVTIISFAFLSIAIMKPSAPSENTGYERMHYIAEDAMQLFGMTKFSEISSAVSAEILGKTNVTEDYLNKSILDVVGMLWADGKTEYVGNISRDFFPGIIPPEYSYAISVKDAGGTKKILYSSTGAPPESGTLLSLTKASRIVSGYRENTPARGYIARAAISTATKRMQSYAYFGGFEGSGNITKILALPSSVDGINEAYMEMDTPSNFTLYINGMYSGAYGAGSTGPMRAKNWTIDSMYYPNFAGGSNNITLAFADINSAYVGGGFIRAKYNTTILDNSDIKMNPDGNATTRYYFPGIDGLVNIYSSLYVPGILNSLGMRLHYASNGTVYLIIGNTTVYQNATNTTQVVWLNDTFLSSILNYALFNQTMPIRFGTKNVTGLAEGSDVVLITDLSGSMTTCDVTATSADCSGSAGIQNRRIDVAKSSDKEFVNTILSNPGQRAGIVAYNETTIDAKTVYLTSDNVTLINMINAYSAAGNTCISCGIKNSTDMLASTVNSTILISNKSAWSYNDSYLLSEPPLDSQGRDWKHVNYSLASSWKSGNAVFGNGSYSIPITTGIFSNKSTIKYPDLWDMTADKATPEVDFTSGINYTANTFGLGAGYDGWDWGAKYDFDNTTVIYSNFSGKIVISTQSGAPLQNRCTNGGSTFDCSGGYGIEINITPDVYATLSSGGTANLSFAYMWNATASTFSNSDEVWVKGRWTSPGPVVHYLGSELSNAGGDTTLEIASGANPNTNFSGRFFQNITPWITGPGMYYLDFGGKLLASANNKNGNFSFDNILLEISNSTETTYFRKNFTIFNLSSVGKGILKVMSDDYAEFYLNGALILSDFPEHSAAYWNSVNAIDRKYFIQGENVIAVKLHNRNWGPSRFDLELAALNDTRNKAMLVMSDGFANRQVTPLVSPYTSGPILAGGSFNTFEQDAINRSCYAYENYGIISYSVGFGTGADAATLGAIAACGRGSYYSSNDADELEQIYRDIANSMISYTTQEANITGDSAIAKLFTDSYIEYNYTPAIDLSYGNITLAFESNTFGNTSGNYSVEIPKNGSYNISADVVVIDAKTTSYSTDYWTSTVDAASQSQLPSWKTVFNLSTFGTNYLSLGDPYIVNIPASLVKPGELNYVRVNTAKNSTDFAGGSPGNRIIYTIEVLGSVDYGAVNETAEGAKADAAQRLLDALAPLGITATDIEIDETGTGGVPWMYGPAIITLEVWKS